MFCDTVTAVHYVTVLGGMSSAVCNDICLQIWNWCGRHGAWLMCSHVPGALTLLADGASRRFTDRYDRLLNGDIFPVLCSEFGVPSIDLFASRLRDQVPRFCSW